MLRISLRNLMAVPKKTLLMIVVFSFFAIFVGLAYGGYVIVSDQASFNSNYHFSYTGPDRIVVKRTDNQPLSAEDLAELSGYSQVKHVIEKDYALDFSIALYSNINVFEYLQVSFLPLSMLPTDIVFEYGGLPTEDDQVVIAGNPDTIRDGEEAIGIFLESMYSNQLAGVKFEVAGLVTNDHMLGVTAVYNNYVYVSDNYWEMIQKSKYLNEFGSVMINAGNLYTKLDYDRLKIDPTLSDDEVRLPNSYMNGSYFCIENLCETTGFLNIQDYYVDETLPMTLIMDTTLQDFSIYVNQSIYDQIFYDEIYQVSLMTKSDINVESLVNQIARVRDGLVFKYKLVYPFDSAPYESYQALILLMASIGVIALLIVTMVGSTFITYVIFKMIINTKLHDYAIFRTIGANHRVIKTFIYVENLYIVAVAFIVFLALSLSIPMNVMEPFNAFKVFDIYRYFIYLILLVLMSLFVSRRYCNKIFSNSVSKTLKTDLE